MALPLSSLTLVRATPGQILASRKRTFLEWGHSLTIEHYLRRDYGLDKCNFAADGKYTTWYVQWHINLPDCLIVSSGF
jgi:hypothetical protein